MSTSGASPISKPVSRPSKADGAARRAASPPPLAAPRASGGYRLGVDVGGTFTDLLLLDEKRSRAFTAKVPSTPSNSSIGVLNGIEKICREAGIDPTEIDDVMHGTTVATNTVLTKAGARVGLVTTKGFRDVLQIARSYVPGGPRRLGHLQQAAAARAAGTDDRGEGAHRRRRLGADPARRGALRRDLADLPRKGIEALTVSLFNAYVDGRHERRIAEIAREVMPSIPVSISSDVIPEMYEYERAETTVVNSYIRPVVSKYVQNLERELSDRMSGVRLHILRSDGGLSSAGSAMDSPVNLLMSGPAGGVAGALGIATRAGFDKLLTFDMGGTSTDVALIENGLPQTRRETRVGDVTVRAPSIDVRTVGAGGGSIAYVPELTKALRVGPQSAGAAPGPAAYGKGGEAPTVTDANVVLGYLPGGFEARRRHDDRPRARRKGGAEDRRRARPRARKGGRGHRQYRQREHVRRAAARVDRAGLRSARFRADRLRRRGAAPRQCAGQAHQLLAGHRAAGPRRALRLWRRDDAAAQRGLAHAGAAFRHADRRAGLSVLSELDQDAHKALASDGVRGFGTGDALSDRHALCRPGHEADGRRDARRFPRRRPRGRR